MLVLGLSIAHHDTAAALASGGRLVAAVAQERVTRCKRDGMACGRRRVDPSESVRYCLDAVGATLGDVDMIVWSHVGHASAAEFVEVVVAEGGVALPAERMVAIPHHFAHACSASLMSPFEDSAVMVLDGGGGPVDTIGARCAGPEADALRSGAVQVVRAPGCRENLVEVESYYDAPGGTPTPRAKIVGQACVATIGPQYSAATHQLLGNPLDCGKTMGLAAYGAPAPEPLFLAERRGDGPSTFVAPGAPRRAAMEETIRRWREQRGIAALPECAEACSYAASIQAETERAIVAQARWLRRASGRRHLCMAGGVALNCVANTAVLRESGFDDVFVPPAPGDDGVALGCALHGAALAGEAVRPHPGSACLGRPWATPEALPGLRRARCAGDPLDFLAGRLADGDVVAWFVGRSEFGPRALGARSFLADPRRPATRDRINRVTKRREAFRPFAPVVLSDAADRFFGERAPSAYMSFAVGVRREHAASLGAVTHVDGTARYQVLCAGECPPLAELLRLFERRTGLPVLLNTSFNQADEPLVESPTDAARCFLNSGAEWLYMDGALFEPEAGTEAPC